MNIDKDQIRTVLLGLSVDPGDQRRIDAMDVIIDILISDDNETEDEK